MSKQVPAAIDILKRSREIISLAIDTITDRNESYNGNGIEPSDYMINGVDDYVRMIHENALRLSKTRDIDKAVDQVAYSALLAAWARAGAPPSQFATIWQQVKNKINDETFAQQVAVTN